MSAPSCTQFTSELQCSAVYFRVAQVERLEGIDHEARYQIVARLLVIGGHDIPGCPGRAAFSQCVSIGFGVVVPECSLIEVSGPELPILLRIRQPIEQALTLLFRRYVQKELQNLRSGEIERSLEVVDLCVAGRPHLLRRKVPYADDEHVLVLRPIEDANMPFLGRCLMDTPEKIVTQLERSRLLERRHGATCRVARAEDLSNGAILAGRIAPLQHHEQRVSAIRVKLP